MTTPTGQTSLSMSRLELWLRTLLNLFQKETTINSSPALVWENGRTVTFHLILCTCLHLSESHNPLSMGLWLFMSVITDRADSTSCCTHHCSHQHMAAQDGVVQWTYVWTTVHGHMDTWTHGHMDTWTHGHMDTWTHGHMDTWTHGHMDGHMDGHMTYGHITHGHMNTCHMDT